MAVNEDYVLLATAPNSHTADILGASLEAEDIPVLLQNSNILRVDPLLSSAVGWVRIMVPASRYDEAREILQAPLMDAAMLDEQALAADGE